MPTTKQVLTVACNKATPTWLCTSKSSGFVCEVSHVLGVDGKVASIKVVAAGDRSDELQTRYFGGVMFTLGRCPGIEDQPDRRASLVPFDVLCEVVRHYELEGVFVIPPQELPALIDPDWNSPDGRYLAAIAGPRKWCRWDLEHSGKWALASRLSDADRRSHNREIVADTAYAREVLSKVRQPPCENCLRSSPCRARCLRSLLAARCSTQQLKPPAVTAE
jgi:hypothetical protein